MQNILPDTPKAKFYKIAYPRCTIEDIQRMQCELFQFGIILETWDVEKYDLASGEYFSEGQFVCLEQQSPYKAIHQLGVPSKVTYYRTQTEIRFQVIDTKYTQEELAFQLFDDKGVMILEGYALAVGNKVYADYPNMCMKSLSDWIVTEGFIEENKEGTTRETVLRKLPLRQGWVRNYKRRFL